MAEIIRFQLRRDSAANWAAANPVLADGEPGIEKDTRRQKIGDGVSTWNELGYSDIPEELVAQTLSAASETAENASSAVLARTGAEAAREGAESAAARAEAVPTTTDEIVRELITDPTSLARGELNATYASKASVDAIPATYTTRAANVSRRGARFAHLGDSLSTTVSGGGNTHWAWLTPLLLKGQLVHVLNAGIGGNTSAQILARVPDVIASGVRYCTVLAGANDHNAATTKANLPQIYDALVGAGIEPIPVLMMPNNADTELPIIAEVNAWISDYAERRGWLVLDAHTPLVDQATGKFKAGHFFDGTHPNETGHIALGRAFAAQLTNRLGGWTPKLTNYVSDPLNVGGEGIMVTPNASDPNKSITWSTAFASGTAPAATVSLVPATTADGITGKWQRISLAVGNNGKYLFRRSTNAGASTFAVGDKMRMAFRLRTAGHEGNLSQTTVSIGFSGADASTILYPIRSWSADVDGTFVEEFTIPAGTTAMVMEFTAQSTVAIAGAATSDLGALTITNLTKRGVV